MQNIETSSTDSLITNKITFPISFSNTDWIYSSPFTGQLTRNGYFMPHCSIYDKYMDGCTLYMLNTWIGIYPNPNLRGPHIIAIGI